MTGDDYALVKKETPASRRKVIGLALAMSIPVFVWFISGYMLSAKVLGLGTLKSLLTAVCCSLVVFLMEKLIVMSKGGKALNFLRIFIGFILATLGSLSIDEVVFHDDISRSVERMKVMHAVGVTDSAKADFERLHGYHELRQRIQESQERYETAESDVINEANGTYGTGKKGVGRITELKDRKAADRKQDLGKLYAALAALDSSKAAYVETERQKALATFSENGLLTRIKALTDLVKSDFWMMFTYAAFTLLMLFIEFLVVIFKSTWPTTNYERRMEMIERIGERRMGLLMTDGSPVYDPTTPVNHTREVRRFLNTPVSLT
jgi:hypothetical protein